MREIRTLRSRWRGLETESSDHRASSRPYQVGFHAIEVSRANHQILVSGH